ncbi:hypothetical protein CHS0354_000759 [Potamilus streckersoni]|uniref:leucine--tRNA ligase n=1 Tax=Potamilus streckersoni TaxID=2493646 RepID=A0AAE0T794_9BIVA|nr:hypothetical protein CHS0354_000759 [Potamilus streckersoni]
MSRIVFNQDHLSAGNAQAGTSVFGLCFWERKTSMVRTTPNGYGVITPVIEAETFELNINQSVMNYDFAQIEEKWQKYWELHQTFKTKDDFSKPKYYVLDMFPYPSGSGLHVGHIEGYTATDIVARYKRLKGFNVLHPIGWDAFGLPAEQHAMKTGIHPEINTKQNIENFRRTLKSLGFSYDWSREINTTAPDYYKWTQWIFSRLYEMGLAYIAEMPVNWCPELKAVIADEEIEEQLAKGYTVVQRPMRQWMLRITAYSERLLNDLNTLDEWPESLKEMQRNWIGRSEGMELQFRTIQTKENHLLADEVIRIYTTRPDTLFGATYMVLAPEHPLVLSLATDTQLAEVKRYIETTARKSTLERTGLQKEKTGVFTGSFAINPANKKPIPIWISDFVLISYGTGAIMSVPAHDARDWEFAKKYGIPIEYVIHSDKKEDNVITTKDGICINSKSDELNLNGLSYKDAFEKTIEWAETQKIGQRKVNYKLRDWIFSRQRYWGEPIPIKHYEQGRIELETSLPLVLPSVQQFLPSETGESPLSRASHDWLNGKDELGSFRRETNTMPQWGGSCWYYLRYLDPTNKNEVVSKEKEKYWMNVDLYVGGAEHAVLHLLYARFWHKVLFDLNIVSTIEPFRKLVNQGIILGENGQKMSKSVGNVVPADVVLKKYGSDTIRLYEMFMGPIEQTKPWSMSSIEGLVRFLGKVWRLVYPDTLSERNTFTNDENISRDVERLMHKTIKQVEEDIEALRFNTAISAIMIYVNALIKEKCKNKKAMDTLCILLSPFAPHITEELWELIGNAPSVSQAKFPNYDEELVKNEIVNIAVQVNGKLRGVFSAPIGLSAEELITQAKNVEHVANFLKNKMILKEITVPNKLVNIVTK